jgi:hypothetical protein
MEEMKATDLNDRRLTMRLCEVLSQFAARPTASIPAACGGRAELEAAYRLFDNEKVTFENILESHQQASLARIAAQEVVILAQDTTEVDLTRPEQQVEGAGPLDHSRRGALLHLLHAFSVDGTPLGTLHAETWTRDDSAAVRLRSLSRAQRAQTPLEDKESYRWVLTMRHASEVASQAPQTQVVCVADSEADVYEVMAQDAQGAQWIVRSAQNRALQDSQNDAPASLRERLLAQKRLFEQTILVRSRKLKVSCSNRVRQQPRKARAAAVEIRAARVTLRPPWRPGKRLSPLTVNAVLVLEREPPKDQAPIEWMLLTSLPIDTVEDVRKVVDYYCVRWMVEVFFRTLKTGCRAEERRFEHIDRQLRCLAVYLIVAWRSLYVCRLSRSKPDQACDALFETAEWKSVYRVVQNKLPPQQPPRMMEMVRMIAQLGGYVPRPRGAPPGPQTVWLGLQRMQDFARCWELFGPDSQFRP